ncbi:NADH dehydrogenase i, a subunit [Neorickettsia risticii str. Illinois]|uniref:NADH-quinone oxidoreductase subunit A n=2 Tax=Neorickettsia risticii TaxID=950 RepID=C6V4S3_NEORI|nr:NADH dehydrogenase i, a subunit [Neorickettsia risticii str. Illinois]
MYTHHGHTVKSLSSSIYVLTKMLESPIVEIGKWVMEGYIFIGLFFVVACFISCVMLILPVFIAPSSHERHKGDSYECGFDKLSSTGERFNVRFYLVGILFIVFDLEIIFLFPWAVSARELGPAAFVSVLIFLVILTVGFVYEFVSGALDWR